MKRNIKLTIGNIYTNRNGSKYRCKAMKEPGCYVMQRIKDNWTLEAHIITQYEDGSIEWDFSSGGYWANRFQVWKDCELGQTYHVESFDTELEAFEWIQKNERYYPGWHLRIVEV